MKISTDYLSVATSANEQIKKQKHELRVGALISAKRELNALEEKISAIKSDIASAKNGDFKAVVARYHSSIKDDEDLEFN